MSKSSITLRGFYRVKLGEDKNGKTEVIGDSGWNENAVMDLGFQDYICALMGSVAGQKVLDQMAVGTGGTPNVTDTALPGHMMRQTAGFATVASKTLRATLAIASSDHPGTSSNISNIALLNSATGTTGSIMCGNTFASSQWATNQGLSATYELQFATA